MRIRTPASARRLFFSALLMAAGHAHAQTTLKTLYGNSADDQFGFSVRGAGDVNNDGFADVIVGARWDDIHGSNSGRVTVYNGKTFAVLYNADGDTQYDHLGTSVSTAGDVNADGWADFIAGADGDDNTGGGAGSARVWSGKTGAILYTFNGDAADDAFGTSVSGAGDVNNDGFADVIVGAPFDDDNGISSGTARVLSGKTGAILYTFKGVGANDFFGVTVSHAGDVNSDGFDDVIVGAPYADSNGSAAGMARVLSGQNGAILYTFKGTAAGDNFGSSVGCAGDVNLDGFSDVIVGAPYADPISSEAGEAKVFSGKTGAVLLTLQGDSATDLFGTSVSGAGDINHDGRDDVIVGSIWDDVNGINSGSAKVFSGANGALLMTVGGDLAQIQLGASVSGVGDVNGDGRADFMASSYLDDTGGANAGLARVYSGMAGGGGVVTYCTGKMNSAGCIPQIASSGTPKVSGTAAFTISCSQVLANRLGLVFYGFASASQPFHGGTLCVATPLHRTPPVGANGSGTGCTGNLAFDFNAWIRSGADPTLAAGETVFAQWWSRDGGAASGDSLSNALRFTIAP
jgi:hypothetical protein